MVIQPYPVFGPVLGPVWWYSRQLVRLNNMPDNVPNGTCRTDYPAMVINKSLKAEPTSGTGRP